MINCTRQADEYLTADSLSLLGYGELDQLLIRMGKCTDDELQAWIDISMHDGDAIDNYHEMW